MRWLVCVLALGCAAPKQIAPLSVAPIEWNPAHVDVGKVAAVADTGSEIVVFGDRGASSFVNGSFVATDGSITKWRGAGLVPAADGNGDWLVGVDGDGKLRRLRGRTTLEEISARWGLGKTPVLDLASMGLGRVVFALDHGAVALADGDKVTRYDLPFTAVAGGGGRAVGILPGDALRAVRPTASNDDSWKIGARWVAVDGSGRVYAANERAVWAEDASGTLRLVYESTAIHGLCAPSTKDGRAWFVDGSELGVVERDRVAKTNGANVAPNAKLVASPSGDVWTLEGGALKRYGTVRAASQWDANVASIQARVCSGCHGPDGSAGLDLSTAAHWDGHRAAIVKRVVEDKTMPPPGTPITDAERAAIGAWAKAP